ncbi:integrase core domain-containing protein [Streptomyces sp. NPDC102274]|uniref:integrase core domain-containing protein n=1 Tax=Streptomyces sp. NPDC102274 TaxID=3366151 RepID=UPI0037F1382B
MAEHLDNAGIAASVGSVGDAYDNALMESTIGPYKTEAIKPGRPWKTLSQVELANAEWVNWYNHRRSRPSSTRPTPTKQPRNPRSQPPTEISNGPGAVHLHIPGLPGEAGRWRAGRSERTGRCVGALGAASVSAGVLHPSQTALMVQSND